jgi:ribosomal protein S18 acetylase RimI-like enzyme
VQTDRAPVSIRLAEANDLAFLEEMALIAMWWDEASSMPALIGARQHPEFVKLLAGWGRPGDCALIAASDAQPVGAAWYRVWTESHHSYGYVDDRTPELGIAVQKSHRGLGIGRMLLRELVALARRDGFARLSLSVSESNPAQRLYLDEGFAKLTEVEGGSRTWLKDLA